MLAVDTGVRNGGRASALTSVPSAGLRYNRPARFQDSPQGVIDMSTGCILQSAAAQPSEANIQLMQLTSAGWTSRCLHVVAEMGIADALGDQPQSTETLAQSTSAHPQSLYRVLRLLASVGIFEFKDVKWHHTEASRLLRSYHSGSLRDYVRMIGLPELQARPLSQSNTRRESSETWQSIPRKVAFSTRP